MGGLVANVGGQSVPLLNLKFPKDAPEGAKADGHVDERERALIEGEFVKLDNDQELQRWLHAELNKPLDPTDVARAASTPEMAAEMYIASVMLVDEENFMEKSYLDELARQLKLEPGLKIELEKQVRQATL